MKKVILGALMLITFQSYAQHSLKKIWQTSTFIPVPESVLKVAGSKVMYVAQIDGESAAADGKGAIGKLGTDGKVIDLNWVSGLNAPKGMAIYKGFLYVADITEVAVINIKEGKIVKRITIPETKFLNDVTIDNKGTVYVSDTRLNKIYSLKNDVPELYLSDVKSVNGLKAIGTDLYYLAGPELWKADASAKLTKLAQGFELGGDGLEPVNGGDFLVSCWGGLIYYVTADGKIQKLLDTRQEKINTADIGYDPAKKIIYVPTFLKNSVIAYQLK